MTFVQSGFSLSSPDKVAVDAAGDIFVANGGGGDVLKLAAGSNSASTVKWYQPNNPASVAIDGAGDVYIGQYGPTVLEVPAGCTQAQIQTCQKSLGGFGEAPAIAVDAAGDIFVGDQYNREVFEIPFSNQGTQTVVYNPNDSSFLPQGLAVDLAGDLFIADYPEHKVLELPPGGSIPTTVGFGWNSPQSVTLDAAGDLYVADSGLREVVEIPAGCTVASCQLIVASATDLSLGSNFGPYGVALDSLGNVYIADVGLNRVDNDPPAIRRFDLFRINRGQCKRRQSKIHHAAKYRQPAAQRNLVMADRVESLFLRGSRPPARRLIATRPSRSPQARGLQSEHQLRSPDERLADRQLAFYANRRRPI